MALNKNNPRESEFALKSPFCLAVCTNLFITNFAGDSLMLYSDFAIFKFRMYEYFTQFDDTARVK